VYKIDLPRRVAKQLDKVAQKDYLAISKAIYNLKENPRPVACKKILESFYRVRVGDYRIIYWIDDKTETIILTKVDRRKERTYKHF
jgi:mRNA interferase RelE/StbE